MLPKRPWPHLPTDRPNRWASCATGGCMSARSDVNQLAPPPPPHVGSPPAPLPRPGANCKSSKLGSWPINCLHSDGTRRIPKGHSWTTAIPKRRPRNLVQRSGCGKTLPGAPPSSSARLSVGRQLSTPGNALSCTRPPGAGRKRPRRHLLMSPPACVRKARVTPPPPWPSSPCSPMYCTRRRPGRRRSGGASRMGPIVDASSLPRSTLSVDFWAATPAWLTSPGGWGARRTMSARGTQVGG
mmetsp:Transcript_53696/g.141549  ORF Transcript_53696/g.141549 Transcript_53696/m.141549 type:complete len:241 (+) Transcript_53696:1400-2122(+)